VKICYTAAAILTLHLYFFLYVTDEQEDDSRVPEPAQLLP
jgi:hypothetical protein